MGIFGLVMICMQIPQKTMHHKFVGAPRNTLHKQISSQKNQKRNHLLNIK
jgi:hypothetical protein